MSFIKQKRFWIPVSFVLLICLVTVGFILLSPSSSPAAPVISWSPGSVNETISPGGSKVANVSFTSLKDLSNVDVWVVPELQPYIQVQPSSFAQIINGQTNNLSLTISASQNAPLGTFDGTIHIRQGKITIAKPLQIAINVWQFFSDDNLGINLYIPPNLSRIDPELPKPSLKLGEGYTFAIYRSISNNMPIIQAPINVPYEGCTIYFGVEDNSSQLNLLDWLNTYSYTRTQDIDEEIILNDIISVRRTGKGEIFDNPFITVFIPFEDRIYTITGESNRDLTDFEQCQYSLEQIIGSLSLKE